MEINLNSLLQNYNSELINKLRGFNENVDYLQYWVPSSSKKKSLFNLIDAINETEITNFSILISKKDKYLIDEIEKISNKIGNISIDKKKDNYKINISLNKKKYSLLGKKVTLVKRRKLKEKTTKKFYLNKKKENYNILKEYEKNLKISKLNYNKSKNENSIEIFSENIDIDDI